MDNGEFQYVRICRGYPKELAELLMTGESAVLLGPRYVGKRHTVNSVLKELERAGQQHVLRIGFMDERWDTRAKLRQELAKRLSEVLRDLEWRPPEDLGQLGQSLGALLRDTPCHLFALISDIDSLPDHMARRLLKGVQKLTSISHTAKGQFTVLLTGSMGLAPLVYGADSDFTCARQFVIQGYDEDAFGDYVDKLVEATGWRLAEPERCLAELFKLCGGSIYMLRILFWGNIEGRRVRGVDAKTPLTVKEILEASAYLYSPMSTPVDFVVRAFSRIENSPDCCRVVDLMLKTAELPYEALAKEHQGMTGLPTGVELAGLAARHENGLRFASPLMERIARQHFTDWRLGDFFACSQQWGEAFAHYKQAAGADEPWTYSPASRPQLPSALRAFNIRLHALAADAVSSLRQAFVQGAMYLLGFDEVSFWQFKGDWRPAEPSTQAAKAPEVQDRIRSILPDPGLLKYGVHELDVDVNAYAILIGMPADIPTDRMAVVVSNFGREAPITRERREFCESVIESFYAASAGADRISQDRRDAHVRKHLLQAIPEILDAVGSRPGETLAALSTAADRIREIGYRRVMFAMVNPDRTRIRGVFDSRPEGEPDIAAMTDWPLDGPIEDVQQECVLKGKIVEAPEAARHPLTNRKVVGAARIGALVLVPIFHHGEVIGTIHVERTDKALPPPLEVEALVYFAEQLGKVINLTERANMLEAAIRAGIQPLLMLDRRQCIRFVNEAVAGQLRLPAGWQDDRNPPDGRTIIYPKSLETVQLATKAKHRMVQYVQTKGNGPVKHLTLEAVPTKDWRGEDIGTVLQTHDITMTRCLFEQFKRLASCRNMDELTEGVLDATKSLGHERGRLYWIDPESGRLIGRKQYGFHNGSKEASDFAEGKVVLTDRGTPKCESWKCFETGLPVMFSYEPERKDRETYVTESGLHVTNVVDPPCPEAVRRQPGDVFIDFPLYSRGTKRELGKLTLQGSVHLDPERFEMLNILAEVSAALFAAMERHEGQIQSEAKWQRRAMETVIAEASHHILSRLSSLGLLQWRYNNEVRELQDVKVLNLDLDRLLRDLGKELEDMKRRMAPIKANRRRTDVAALVCEVLRERLPEAAYTVTPASGVEADADEDLLRRTLLELVANSENAKKASEGGLHIDVELSTTGEQQDSRCHIIFRDNGPGIPRDCWEKVFQPLYSHWPGQEPGTGLGLAFVRRAVEAHDGTISLRERGQGACFLIAFPRFESPRTERIYHDV